MFLSLSNFFSEMNVIDFDRFQGDHSSTPSPGPPSQSEIVSRNLRFAVLYSNGKNCERERDMLRHIHENPSQSQNRKATRLAANYKCHDKSNARAHPIQLTLKVQTSKPSVPHYLELWQEAAGNTSESRPISLCWERAQVYHAKGLRPSECNHHPHTPHGPRHSSQQA